MQSTMQTKETVEEINKVSLDGDLIRIFLTMGALKAQANGLRMQPMYNEERWHFFGGLLMNKASRLRQEVGLILNGPEPQRGVTAQQRLEFIRREIAVGEGVLLYAGLERLEKVLLRHHELAERFPTGAVKIAGAIAKLHEKIAVAWMRAHDIVTAEDDAPGTVTEVTVASPSPPTGGTPDALFAGSACQSTRAAQPKTVKRAWEEACGGSSQTQHDEALVADARAAKRVRVGSTEIQFTAKELAVMDQMCNAGAGRAPVWKPILEKLPEVAARMTRDKARTAYHRLNNLATRDTSARARRA